MIIALEEHYFDPQWNDVFDERHHDRRNPSPFISRLADLGALRIREMDEAGITMQVISHAPPGAQGIVADAAVGWACAANDRLAAAIALHPDRFAGLAAIPTSDGRAGASELGRCVSELGFKGGMLHTIADGVPLEDRSLWPIYERAAVLGVPLYIHPSEPGAGIRASHYRGFAESHPMFIRAGWGFMVEAGTQAMRLVLSGVFDAHPDLKLILGHLGETIPYQIARIDEALSRDTPMKNFREVFTRHFYVTTSGFFSDAALRCAIDELGVDRVMFSVDWPWASNKAGADWIRTTALSDGDREKIMSGNARALLGL